MKLVSRIYVAAASAPIEIDRAERWRQRLGSAGLETTCTWIANIAGVGAENPRDASAGDRRIWASTCLAEIEVSDLVWFLVPPAGVATRGAWFEVGVAEASDKALVFSGDTRQSIFCALGREFYGDEDAFAYITKIAREGLP